MSRITAVIFLIIALLLPTLGMAGWFYSQRALPVVDGVVTIPELVHPADVRYDERGVPYIQTRTQLDALVTQGYVTASERMFQMDVLRRTAKGELAEVFGLTALAHDKMMRKLGIAKVAKEEFKLLPPELKAELEAYARGVNSYIEFSASRRPLEFLLLGYQPVQWQPADSLAILKYNQYDDDESWQLDDLRQRVVEKVAPKLASVLFEQQLKSGTVGALSPEPKTLISDAVRLLNEGRMEQLHGLPIWGSNSWSINGSLSDSKSSILAYDSHSSFTSPDKYFICSLATPAMHVAGATIPGVPGIVAGRNEHIAFSSTVLRADTQDLVVEQLSPQFPGKYKTVEGWDTLKESAETISVRGVPGFSKNVEVPVQQTRHGPVLIQTEKNAVSLSWTGFDAKQSYMKTILLLDRAKSLQEFNSALAGYGGSPRTFMYVDKQGTIAYHVAGAFPVKSSSGLTVTPGWTGEGEWHGRINFDDLPHGQNPANGYIVADNPQFVSTVYYNNPLRAIRIGSVLSAFKQANQHVGLPEMAVLQGDTAAAFAPLVKNELELAITRTQNIDVFQTEALALLKQWDGNLAGDSAAAAVYESFLRTLTRRVLQPKLGALMTQEYLQRWPRWSLFSQRLLSSKPPEWLPPEERTYDAFLVTTFAQALKNVRLAAKTDDLSKISWQGLHQIKFQPLLKKENYAVQLLSPLWGVNPVGAGGDQDAVNACNVAASVDPWNFSCDSGPTFRMLVDMSDADKFYASLPLGQSEHLFSPYKSDQLLNWLRLEPHSIAFSFNQLDKQQQHKVIFTNQ